MVALDADVAGFAASQARILEACGEVVRPAVKLYATCSVFPEETGCRSSVFWPDNRRPAVAGRTIAAHRRSRWFYYCRLDKLA